MEIANFILGAFGTLAGGLSLWILWRTYLRDSEKQRREQERENQEREREEQASQPMFRWIGLGGSNYATIIDRLDVHRFFVNEGGAITNIEAKSDGDVQVSVTPKDYLGEHREAKIEFQKLGVRVLPDIRFEIHYSTRLDKRCKKSFVWKTNGEPEEIK